MRRSLESSSRSRNMDMGKDPEGIYGRAKKTEDEKPISYEEHMRNLERIMAEIEDEINQSIAYANKLKSSEDGRRGQDINNARNLVLEAYKKDNKSEAQNSHREFEYKKPENMAAYNEQLNNINAEVRDVLFSSFTDIRRMIGDEQYDNLVDTINEDIYNGKYENAKFENGLIHDVGSVNENGRKSISVGEKNILKNAEFLKVENEEKYSKQVEDIDPKVFEKIGSVMYILGTTLGDQSIEYVKARHKIMSDIYDGRYKNAKYEVTSDENDGFERGIIVFN